MLLFNIYHGYIVWNSNIMWNRSNSEPLRVHAWVPRAGVRIRFVPYYIALEIRLPTINYTLFSVILCSKCILSVVQIRKPCIALGAANIVPRGIKTPSIKFIADYQPEIPLIREQLLKGHDYFKSLNSSVY